MLSTRKTWIVIIVVFRFSSTYTSIGGDSIPAGSTDVLQLTEDCLCFSNAGSDVCIFSFMAVQDIVDIGGAVNLLRNLTLDCGRCVVGCVVHEQDIPSVDDQTQSR
ncbi:hypothetical protein DPMN_053299 [Dreissena polymorpha]|uniref:Secreted protein n=1 Tax=Dreissena polymorpha TaxID=45954 RepID=A0A9D4CL40_DREPO|nr:hypothetical protein DPMN_053299 [Dreissena polymorpha]